MDSLSFEVKLDAGAIIVGFSEGAEAISGYQADEVLGKNWFEVFITEGDIVKVLKVFQDIFLGKNLHWDNTNEIRIKSGETISIYWSNQIIMDENGNRLHVLAKGSVIE